MNMPFKAWLPQGAMAGGAVERTLRDIAAHWSQKWFARKTLGLVDCPAARHLGGLPDTEEMAWRCHEGGLAIGISDTGRLGLSGLMLDIAPREPDLTSADRWLLDRLAISCLDDLCTELAGAMCPEAPETWLPANDPPRLDGEIAVYRFGTLAGRPLIHLLVDRSAAASLIRTQAAARNRPPLQPLSVALARQAVRVSACLGSCSISLAELAELGPGDVIVLDRRLDMPLEIAVDGRNTSARCAAEAGDSKLHLKIVKPLNG